jgi:hypothetical protein
MFKLGTQPLRQDLFLLFEARISAISLDSRARNEVLILSTYQQNNINISNKYSVLSIESVGNFWFTIAQIGAIQ